ncbi:hypothetical protein EYC80_008930 [Monilinia laxa]|uniref:Uncharacterized protein n=1 Tax=Monilinia laxa TaxID=61186 RepID=A0A5N6K1Z5_MONLA|nr:hypothetical protein EYC80_008930 [Monilinia laxa]
MAKVDVSQGSIVKALERQRNTTYTIKTHHNREAQGLVFDCTGMTDTSSSTKEFCALRVSCDERRFDFEKAFSNTMSLVYSLMRIPHMLCYKSLKRDKVQPEVVLLNIHT